MTRVVTLEDALEIVKQLSPLDKVRLIEKVTPDIKQQLAVTTHQPRKSLRGLWRSANISDADIADVTHIPHPKLSQREITERKNQSEHKNK
ncbi:MAG: hypothetical protein ACKN9A_08410, partial [Microcystis aeruginosa]